MQFSFKQFKFFEPFKPHYVKRVANLAVPAVMENVLATLVTFADTIMVGSLGAIATAAVAINSSPTWLLGALTAIFGVGGMVFVARFIGAQDKEQADAAANTTIASAFLVSVVLFALVSLICPFIPAWMGAAPEVMPDALKYIRILSFSIIPQYIGMCSAGVLRGAGNTKTPMYVAIATNIIDVCGNFLLIFPTREIALPFLSDVRFNMWGAGMGVSGAAISTALSQSIYGIILLALLFGKRQAVRLNLRTMLKTDFKLLKRILRVGLPAAGERFAISLGQVFFARMIASMGTIEIAAHYLSIQTESLGFMPSFGLGIAATALVGQSLGAKNKEDALNYSRINLYLGILFGVVVGLVLFIFPSQLLGLFTPDADVIRVGAPVVRLIGVFQPISISAMVFSGTLRGAGDTKITLYSAIFGMWGIRLLSTFVFTYIFGFGLMGAWVGMCLDLTIRMSIVAFRYSRRKWLELNI